MKRVLSAGPSVLVEWRCAALPTWRCVHQSPHFQDSYGGFNTSAPSIINSVSSPSPLPRGWEGEADSSKFIITALSFWWPAYHPKATQEPTQSCLFRTKGSPITQDTSRASRALYRNWVWRPNIRGKKKKKEAPSILITWEIIRILVALCQKLGDYIYISIYTHTHTHIYIWASLVAQTVKHLPTMRETQVRSLGREDPWRRKWQPTQVLLPGMHAQSLQLCQTLCDPYEL